MRNLGDWLFPAAAIDRFSRKEAVRPMRPDMYRAETLFGSPKAGNARTAFAGTHSILCMKGYF